MRHFNGIYTPERRRPLGVYQDRFDLGRWPRQLVRFTAGAVLLAVTCAIYATLFGLL